MFNNDFDNVTNPNDDHSAMQEVTLNEQNMTAQVTWSWIAPEELYSAYWGETAHLPNADRIGVFGTQTHPFAEATPYLVNDTRAVLVEVNQNGQVVRTYTFPRGWGIYRIAYISSVTVSSSSGNTWWEYPVIIVALLVIVVVTAAYSVRSRKVNKENQRVQ
jgi:hypothetical protein